MAKVGKATDDGAVSRFAVRRDSFVLRNLEGRPLGPCPILSHERDAAEARAKSLAARPYALGIDPDTNNEKDKPA